MTLCTSLFKIGAIKFGTFTLKSGLISPIYVDLRPVISYPKLLKSLTEQLYALCKRIDYDLLCGVPYTAVPMATALSLLSFRPMVMHRKEEKAYGTKKLVEGVFSKNQSCLVIEDIITSGSSVLNTINLLEKEELMINDVLIVLDREQGAKEIIESKGYKVHVLFTLTQLLDDLFFHGIIKKNLSLSVKTFIEQNQLHACN